jgi:hypothetical protein
VRPASRHDKPSCALLAIGAALVSTPTRHLDAGPIGIRATPSSCEPVVVSGQIYAYRPIVGLAWVDWLRVALVAMPPPGSLTNIGFRR